MPLAPGLRLGPYEVVSPLGAGGMGEVYRGRDTRLDRSVAIKILPAELASNAELRLRLESGAKLLDFGLAKAAAPIVDFSGATQQKALTQEGTIVGTFQYMSPEQLEGMEADPRTDIFALGAVVYEMATGKRAFEGKTRTSLIAAIVSGRPTPLSQIQPLAPPALEHVIERCLEKDPADRWQSAHDVAAALKWIGAVPP